MKKYFLKDITKNLDNKRKPLNHIERAAITTIGLYPYIGANNIQGFVDQYIFDEKILCVSEDGGSWGPNQTCAKIYIEKCWVNNHAHVLTANDDLVILEFLMNYLNFKDLNGFISGTTRGKLTKGNLESIQIPLPPLSQQKAIAEKLDKADALRKKDQELLAKYDELAQSIFIDMFGDPVKNEKGWEKHQLQNLMKIRRGASPRPISQFIGKDVNWIKIGDATNGDNIYLNSTRVQITSDGARKSVFLKKGSIIFANCGVSLGFCRILNIDGCIHDGWLSFEDLNEKKLNKFYLLTAINFLTDFFRRTAPDGTQPNLNIGIMKIFEIALPPLKLQEKFVEITHNIENQRVLLIHQAQQSEDLFQALLQESFS